MFRSFIDVCAFIIVKTLEFCLPSTCVFCSFMTHDAASICTMCKQNLPILPHHCPICAAFLPATDDSHCCGACLQNPPAYQFCISCFPYQWPIDKIVHKLKFHHDLKFAKLISELMIEKLAIAYHHKPFPEAIIPMPLHKKRLQERGFNQSIEIAKPIAKAFKIKLDSSFKRIKNTKPQTQLNAKQRKQNIQNAFLSAQHRSYRHVAIIDDVVTTGATIQEFSQQLRLNGIAQIDIWTFARRG